jgi:hypothetical protein
MIFYPNIEGIKYFLYLITTANHIIYLPPEIREKIWIQCEKQPYMLCSINNGTKIKLYIKTLNM